MIALVGMSMAIVVAGTSETQPIVQSVMFVAQSV
jgi:hypothetical protein